MRALANEPADSTEARSASRPFDDGRSGFVIGEGSAVVVLERLDAALSRGANIIAEIRGYGLSGDAFHVSAPSSDGCGAFRCMQAAMKGSGVSIDDLDYINAHATSTPLGDEIEARAIGRLIQNRNRTTYGDVLVSSTKGATGHLLGAAGALEAVFAALSVHRNVVPPTLNISNISPAVAEQANCAFVKDGDTHDDDGKSIDRLDRPLRAALSNSFGFGGTNASLLFTKYEAP